MFDGVSNMSATIQCSWQKIIVEKFITTSSATLIIMIFFGHVNRDN